MSLWIGPGLSDLAKSSDQMTRNNYMLRLSEAEDCVFKRFEAIRKYTPAFPIFIVDNSMNRSNGGFNTSQSSHGDTMTSDPMNTLTSQDISGIEPNLSP